MAVEILLDRQADNALTQEGQITRFVRTGIITGLSVAPGNEIAFLHDASRATGMPQMGEICSADVRLQLTRREFRPLSDTMARFFLIYESPYGFQETSYIIRNSAFLGNLQTNMLPGSGTRPFWIAGFSQPGAAGTSEDKDMLPDTVFMNIFRPMRQVSVSVLAYGSPQGDGGDAIGRVNGKPWPVGVVGMAEKPKGYWLCNKYETSLSKYKGYYTVEAAGITRTTQDWSEYGILRNRKTGRYAQVTDTANAVPSWDYAAEARAVDTYYYGRMYPPNASDKKGIARWGPYELSDFAILFGFGGDPRPGNPFNYTDTNPFE